MPGAEMRARTVPASLLMSKKVPTGSVVFGAPRRRDGHGRVMVAAACLFADGHGVVDSRCLDAAMVVLAVVQLRRRRLVGRTQADQHVRVLVAPPGALVVAAVLFAGDDRGCANGRCLDAAVVVLGLPRLDVAARRAPEAALRLQERRQRVARANGHRGRGWFPACGGAPLRRRSLSQPWQARRPPSSSGDRASCWSIVRCRCTMC
jgi:hypothetical protein